MSEARLPFEETPAYMAFVAELNERVDLELHKLSTYLLVNHDVLNPAEVRRAEERCMNRQTAITIEVNRKIAAAKEAYDAG